MKFVLHLQHWQLFGLTFVIPFALYIVFFVTMITSMAAGFGEPQFGMVSIVLGVCVGAAYLVAIGTALSWIWQVANGLYQKLPTGVPMKIGRFRFAFIYPFVYLAALAVFMCIIFLGDLKSLEQGPARGMPPFLGAFFFIIPLHFLAMACGFYMLYFVSKSLRSVELNREAVASEFTAEFVLIWFSFIGVWFIQPRINKIFSSEGPTPELGGALDRM